MKVLFFSDLHAHNWSQFSRTLPGGRNSRLQAILDVVDRIAAYCEEHEISHCFMLGDVFHTRTKIDVEVFSSTWLAFKRLSEKVKHLVILRGNHDSYDAMGETHSLEAFREFAFVIDKPWIGDLDGIQVAAHPYTPNMEDWKIFSNFVSSQTDFFLFHQGVSTGLVGAFNVAIKAEVDIEDLPHTRATYCLGGHYHKHQFMAPNVAFIGSPIQHSFGERDEVKGFLVLEKQDTWTHEFVELERTPKFKQFSNPKELKEALKEGFVVEDNYVKLTCRPSQVTKCADTFPSIVLDVEKSKKDQAPRINKELAADDNKLLSEFLKQNEKKIKSLGLTAEELLPIGLSLLSATAD